MPTTDRPGLMLRIARELRAFHASQDRLDEAAAGALAISRNDLRALEFIARHGNRSPTALARHLRLTTGAVTTLLDRMEINGLLTRTADPHDRRRLLILLTPEGDRRVRGLFGPLLRASTKWLARRPTHDLAVIEQFLAHASTAADAARTRIDER